VNRRYQFRVVFHNDEEIHRKYGADPAEALFRYQLELLRTHIDPKVFKARTKVKKKPLG